MSQRALLCVLPDNAFFSQQAWFFPITETGYADSLGNRDVSEWQPILTGIDCPPAAQQCPQSVREMSTKPRLQANVSLNGPGYQRRPGKRTHPGPTAEHAAGTLAACPVHIASFTASFSIPTYHSATRKINVTMKPATHSHTSPLMAMLSACRLRCASSSN